jgi:Ca-activated chloride channel family protein
MGNYKDSKIEVLAKMGNGNFAYLDSEEEAQKVMVEELTENLYNVAWESSIQIDFDPTWVKSYKLIGYDNRLQALASGKQLLMGNSIGSGQSIVAMFEIIPQTNFQVQSMHIGQWQFQFKKTPEDSVFSNHAYPLQTTPQTLQETDSAFKQATALAWYAMQLRLAEMDQPVSFEQPLALAKLVGSEGNKTWNGFIALLQKTHLLYYPEKVPSKKRKWFKKQ